MSCGVIASNTIRPMVSNMTPTESVKKGLARRYRKERRFRALGLLAVWLGFTFLVILLADITIKALPAFHQTWIKLDVYFDPEVLGFEPGRPIREEALLHADFRGVVRRSLYAMFPQVRKHRDKRKLGALVSSAAQYQVRDLLRAHPDWLGKTVPVWVRADDDVDTYLQSASLQGVAQDHRRLRDNQVAWLRELEKQGRIERRFNWLFFRSADSREPEQAGILGAVVGSFYTLLVTIALAFPLGLAGAVYLEEYAPRSRWVDLIEININNLAAVPSIVFGLLGLAVFINFFGASRSSPLVGGMVLALMTLPTIVIAARAAMKAVPPSIREAALGLGASHTQMVFQHVVPLAMPGILTGTIIGMAQALGETAPLLMVGMVAFIVDIPHSFTDSATVLPVQIYLWADSPERAFVARTSAAILVLLGFLVLMNGAAILLRKRFERKW